MNRSETLELALATAQSALDTKARQKMLYFSVKTKPDYVINWHHITICRYLDKFISGEIKRLIIQIPPRHGKSELVSRRLPAFILGQNPDESIIACSYSADLASAMNRDVQRIIDSHEYRDIFPETTLSGINMNKNAKGVWVRTNDSFEVVNHKGIYRSVGIGGGITGMGGRTSIIDDPIKNQEIAMSKVQRDKIWEWYTSTLYTRLEKDGRILLTLTRWHEDDLAGRLIELAKNDKSADQWTILSLPAVNEVGPSEDDPRNIGDVMWPYKYPPEVMGAMKASVGARVWNSLYQQHPTADQGNIVKRQWFKWYDVRSKPVKFDEVIQVWDLTFKDKVMNDYVVGTVWGRLGADVYLIDMVRDRMDFPKTIQAFTNMTAKHPEAKAKIVEDKANGPALIATLKSKISGIIAFNPEGSKEQRLYAVSAQIESGNVYLPQPALMPSVDIFLEEVVAFPNAPHDDCVDNLTMALIRLTNSGRRTMANLLHF